MQVSIFHLYPKFFFLIWMPKDYFKIPKVIWLINRKILNQPVKFPLLCQFLTQGGFPKPLLNLTCDMHFMLPCSLPCSGLGFCIALQFFSSSAFRTNSLLHCIWIIFWNASPAPIFSPPMSPLNLWYSVSLLLSSSDALGVLLATYIQDQFWMLEEGAHCFDFPWATKVVTFKTEVPWEDIFACISLLGNR